MNDLIQITKTQIGAENVNSVNARNIHIYLEVKTAFSNWIKRAIDKYDFIENEDYAVAKNGIGNNAFIDYIVSMDMAKELCMVENNQIGRDTRKHFIDVEKQSNKPLTIEQLLQENIKVISSLQNKVIEMKPKVLFADSVAQSEGSILIGQFAKLISDSTFVIGQNKLFQWFRDNNYLCSSGSRYNQPMQKYIDNKYFEVIERTVNNPDGSVRTTITTKVTGLGQVKLTSKIKGL
jgi:anti-repressor protein